MASRHGTSLPSIQIHPSRSSKLRVSAIVILSVQAPAPRRAPAQASIAAGLGGQLLGRGERRPRAFGRPAAGGRPAASSTARPCSVVPLGLATRRAISAIDSPVAAAMLGGADQGLNGNRLGQLGVKAERSRRPGPSRPRNARDIGRAGACDRADRGKFASRRRTMERSRATSSAPRQRRALL